MTFSTIPQSGALFRFVNRDGDRMEFVWWDQNDFCNLYKRLERGTFRVPSALARGARADRRCGAREELGTCDRDYGVIFEAQVVVTAAKQMSQPLG